MVQLVSWAVMVLALTSCQGPQGTYVSAAEYVAGGGAPLTAVSPAPLVEVPGGAPAPSAGRAAGPPDEDEIVAKRREFEGRRRGLTRRAEDLDRERADLADKRRKTALEHESEQTQEALTLEDAQRALRRAREDLVHFEDDARARRLREDELTLTTSRDNLQEIAEELAQLEMMYDEADLGDATAEIVLQRTKRRIRRAEERHALAQARSDDLREVTLPREQEDLRAKVDAAALALENLMRKQEAGAIGRALAVRGLDADERGLDRKAEDLAREESELEQDRRRWETGLSARGS